MIILTLYLSNNYFHMDTIRITQSKIKIRVTAFKWKQDDTYFVYVPSLEISSYGNTKEEAVDMMNFSLNEFGMDLKNIGRKNSEVVLSKLGWKQQAFATKNFSHAYIDKDGVIQNLGLEDVEDIELLEEVLSVA